MRLPETDAEFRVAEHHDAMHKARINCAKCGAPCFWARTPKDKGVLLDASPTQHGPRFVVSFDGILRANYIDAHHQRMHQERWEANHSYKRPWGHASHWDTCKGER